MVSEIHAQQSTLPTISSPVPSTIQSMQRRGIADTSLDSLVLRKQAHSFVASSNCIQDFFAALAKWFQALFSRGASSASTTAPATINLGDSPEGRQVQAHIDNKRFFIQDKLGDELNHLHFANFPKFAAIIVKINGRIVEAHHSIIDRSTQQAFCQSTVQKMEQALTNQRNLPSLLQGGRASINIMILTGSLGNDRPYFYSHRDTPQGPESAYGHEEVTVARAAALIAEHCAGDAGNREAEEKLLLALVRQFPNR